MITTEALVVAIGDRFSKRLERAQQAFKRVIELEKTLALQRASAPVNNEEMTLPRQPVGWLTGVGESSAVALYRGLNTVAGAELRLASDSVFMAEKAYASNEVIMLGDRKYLIKLLPPNFRSQGELL